MNNTDLLLPFPGDSPAGQSCEDNSGLLKLETLIRYLAELASVRSLERELDALGTKSGSDPERDTNTAILEEAQSRLSRVKRDIEAQFKREAEAEWAASEAENLGSDLLKRIGKDLRVVRQLCVSRASASGLAGLESGLDLFHQILATWPEHAHPLPDPEAIGRAMLLSEVLGGDGIACVLAETPLLGQGKKGLRIDAVERATDGGAEILSLASKLALEEYLQQNAGAEPSPAAAAEVIAPRIDTIRRIRELARLCATLVPQKYLRGQRTGDLLTVAERFLLRCKSEWTGQDEAVSPISDGTTIGVAGSDVGGGAVQRVEKPRLATRADAAKEIVRIAEFLEKTEPAHPAPLFLRRAERLLRAENFFDIMKDMVPNSVNEVERITGQSAPNT